MFGQHLNAIEINIWFVFWSFDFFAEPLSAYILLRYSLFSSIPVNRIIISMLFSETPDMMEEKRA